MDHTYFLLYGPGTLIRNTSTAQGLSVDIHLDLLSLFFNPLHKTVLEILKDT